MPPVGTANRPVSDEKNGHLDWLVRSHVLGQSYTHTSRLAWVEGPGVWRLPSWESSALKAKRESTPSHALLKGKLLYSMPYKAGELTVFFN